MGEAIWLTLKLAAVTTVLLLLIATPLAWWLARTRSPWREPVLALTALPVVLPPTVIGFYLLIALGPSSPLLVPLQPFGVRSLSFTFTGLVIGSVVYSLPFAVQPIRNAFAAVGRETLEAALTLGATPWRAFARVALPLARPGLLTAAVLTFAHTLGEFGIVLMIGGAIPGRTKVLSIEIFQLVEGLRWREAHILSAGLVALSFLAVLAALLADRWTSRNASRP
ncbi:MAG TPA: molybdate ABC transporter permease subunit [Caulobacteraceae bacterium]|jgi:molybdate transport system permease protein